MDIKGLFQQVRDALNPPAATVNVAGHDYTVKQTPHGPEFGSLIEYVPKDKPMLLLSSVTGLVDVISAGIDGFGTEDKPAVHVESYNKVALLSLKADEYGRRHVWAQAVCLEKNAFPFDEYMLPETFLIKLQMGFLPTDNVVALQTLASSLTSTSSVQTQDDGVSQKVTIEQGAVQRGTVEIPKRIKLLAYRTFREIDPVESEFMVRIKGKQGELPQIALLQVDADKWKHDTQFMLKNWFQEKLPDAVVIA